MILFKNKEKPVTVEEIHETFFTEVDRLLEEARVKKPQIKEGDELIDKNERLKKLGFVSTKVSKKADLIKTQRDHVKQVNENKQRLEKAILYFSSKYPNYKFITESSVNKICEKYGLVFGDVKLFTGDVPDENLGHIEKFKIDDNDICHVEIREETFYGFGNVGRARKETVVRYLNKQVNLKEQKEQRDSLHKKTDDLQVFYKSALSSRWGESSPKTRKEQCPLMIAGPQSDFDMKGMEIEGVEIKKAPVEIPDPVVFQPVYFEGDRHFLIVTAWGDEASDPEVVNEKMN